MRRSTLRDIFAFYAVTWWLVYLINQTALVVLLLVEPWRAEGNPLAIVICVALVAAFANITIADIVTDWICVWAAVLENTSNRFAKRLGWAAHSGGAPPADAKLAPVAEAREAAPASRLVAPPRSPKAPAPHFLVVYCLKSKTADDIAEVLAFLRTSADLNRGAKASYMVLSGTQVCCPLA